MFTRFLKDARDVATQAQTVAKGMGSATIEAEHLLLAVARLPGPAAEALGGAGLDQGAIRGALEDETERSLAAVGVSLSAFEATSTAEDAREPRFASSAKLAFERSLKIAEARKDRRIGPAHILAGVLSAELGTVPRALECAGIERDHLLDRVKATLDG